MSVPFSVSALSANELQKMDLQDMTQISEFEPSFHFVNQAGGGSGRNDRSDSYLSFRGLVLGSTATSANGSGSLFIDGAPVLDAQAPSLDEVERVEVLKGPQSAYFGRSTFAGAINYVTKDPRDDFHVSVSAEQSSYDSHDDYLSLEGPVIKDILDVRVSARSLVHGGEWVNAADPNQMLGEQGTTSFALTALFKPMDALRIKGFFNWFEDDDGPPAQAAIQEGDPEFNCNPKGGVYKGGYICGVIPNANQLNPAIISGNYTMTPYLQAALVQNVDHEPVLFNPDFLDHAGLRRLAFQSDIKADYDLPGGYTLSSISAFHQDKQAEIIDLDFRNAQNVPNPFYTPGSNLLPYYSFNFMLQGFIQDFSQELRITSPQDGWIRWNFGTSYLQSSTPVAGNDSYGVYPLGVGFFAGSITAEKTETPAVFGGINIDVLPKVTLSLEARYQWDDLTQTPVVNASGVNVSGTPAGDSIHSDFRSFAPRAILDYKIVSDTSLYALWSRGYRPGGVNATLASASSYVLQQVARYGASVNFQQERLDNYEAGVKSTFLDGRARVAFDVYYDLWRNGQVPTTVNFYIAPGSQTLNQGTITTNAGAINLYGLEYEGDWQVTNHLLVQTSAAINDSDVKQFSICSDCVDITGATSATGHIPGAPKYTWAISGEYSDHLFDEYTWYGRVDYNHQGSFYVDYTNLAYTHAADLVNLHLGVRNGSFSLEGFVKNALNNLAPLSATYNVDVLTYLSSPSGNMIRYALPDKRTIGVRAKYQF